jgi:serine/threonine-protein kinase
VRSRRLTAAVVTAAVLSSALPLAAQTSPTDKAAAEQLFDDGKRLMIQGQYAQACGKLEQSQRVDPGIGTLLYLAECYEKSGRTASAWATFREAASAARAAGQNDRARAGQQRADKLEASLSKLTLNVAPENNDIPGLEIARGGSPISRALWNIPFPVDPGEHVIEARAPGRKAFSQTVRVGEGAATATLRVPPLEADASAAVPAEASAPSSPAASTDPPSSSSAAAAASVEADATDGSNRRTLALVVGGVGLVGLGVGTFFGLRAMGKNSDAEEQCNDDNVCEPGTEELTDQAKSAAMVSNIGFGLGAAALVGGAILYFTAPEAKPSAARWQLTPVAGTRGGAMFVQGAF